LSAREKARGAARAEVLRLLELASSTGVEALRRAAVATPWSWRGASG